MDKVLAGQGHQKARLVAIAAVQHSEDPHIAAPVQATMVVHPVLGGRAGRLQFIICDPGITAADGSDRHNAFAARHGGAYVYRAGLP